MKKILLVLVCIFILAGAGTAIAKPKERLNIFTWSDYMDPEIVVDFEKRYNIEVKEDLFESNEEMLAKLQSGGLGQYDIIVPSAYILPALINLKLIVPLEQEKLVNFKNISSMFVNPEYDPNNQYTVPYQWGTSTLLVKVKDGEEPEPTWGLLFDPKKSMGGMVMLNTSRDVIGVALKYQGKSLNTINPQEIKEAFELVLETKKRKDFISFDNGVGGRNKVLGGLAQVAQVFNGDALKAVEEDPTLKVVLPKEGSEIWIDLMAIPNKAPNQEAAYKWINYLLEPKVAAKLSNFNRYATPVEEAKNFIFPEDLNNPALYPSDEILANYEFLQDLGISNRLYEEAWVAVKSR